MSVSLVMVVKNEAENLTRCVHSLSGAYDEFILVDTGSTDNTKQVAESLGAKVFDIDGDYIDFAKWRNFAKSKASGDWIITIDADEWCEESCVEQLKGEIANADKDIDALLVRSFIGVQDLHTTPQMIQWVSKVFRNVNKVQWIGERHNLLTVASNRYKKCDGVVFYHSHSVREKNARAVRDSGRKTNVGLFLKKIEEDENDTRSRFYLANSYKDNGNYAEAAVHYEKYLELSKWADERAQAAIYLAECWRNLNKLDDAVKVLLSAIKDRWDRAEIYEMLGDLQDGNEAAFWYESALRCPFPEDSLLFVRPKSYCVSPHRKLAICYRSLSGCKLKALEHARIAVEYEPNERFARGLLSSIMVESKELQKVAPFFDSSFLKSCVSASELKDTLFFGRFAPTEGIRGYQVDRETTPLHIANLKELCGTLKNVVLLPFIADYDQLLLRIMLSEINSITEKILIFSEKEIRADLLDVLGFRRVSTKEVVKYEGVLVERIGDALPIEGRVPEFLKVVGQSKKKRLVVGSNQEANENSDVVIDDVESEQSDIIKVLPGDWIPFVDNEFDSVLINRSITFAEGEIERVVKKPTPKAKKRAQVKNVVVRSKSGEIKKVITTGGAKQKSIDIYCGPCWHEYDDTSLEENSYLRGSSKACVYLAKGLASRGWGVTVFGQPKKEGTRSGVTWLDYEKFDKNRNPTVCLSYRRSGAMCKNSKNLFFCHDAGLYGNVAFFNEYDLILAVSEWMKNKFVEHYSKGSEFSNKCHVVPNGVNIRLINRLVRHVVKDPNLIVHHFAVDRSLTAALLVFEEMRRVKSSLRMIVVGNLDDWEKESKKRMDGDLPRLEETKKRLEITEGVEFIGPVGEQKVFELLLAASLCIFPTNVKESFCMSLMEAKACRTPVVATRLPALTETGIPGSVLIPIQTGGKQVDDYKQKTGIYSKRFVDKFARTSLELLDNKERTAKIVEEGRLDANRYAWNNIVDEFERLALSVVNK